jgi:fatty acid desaturase
MVLTAENVLTHQALYAKTLRPFLPKEAFSPDADKLVVLLTNLAILILGWIMATTLDFRSISQIVFFLPFGVIMANSVLVLALGSHDLCHGSVVRQSKGRYLLSLMGWTVLWMPPTLWQIVHNRLHHTHTNGLNDPDRNYLVGQPNTWSKWVQRFFVPSSEAPAWGLVLGLPLAWGVYTFRNLTSVLFFNSDEVQYLPAAFTVKPKERQRILAEFLVILLIHGSLVIYLELDIIRLIFAYFFPIGLGYAGLICYIFTHHFSCPMTETNDPLINTVSVRIPRLLDCLHLNFSYHTEHHIFPALNSDYYPQVRELLQRHYPDRMGYAITAREAWQALAQTPRFYQDETTLTNWSGTVSVPCPLGLKRSTLVP